MGGQTTQLTRWNEDDDRKLHHMMSYMNNRVDDVLIGFVADPPELLKLPLYSDADFAGDRRDYKARQGCFWR